MCLIQTGGFVLVNAEQSDRSGHIGIIRQIIRSSAEVVFADGAVHTLSLSNVTVVHPSCVHSDVVRSKLAAHVTPAVMVPYVLSASIATAFAVSPGLAHACLRARTTLVFVVAPTNRYGVLIGDYVLFANHDVSFCENVQTALRVCSETDNRHNHVQTVLRDVLETFSAEARKLHPANGSQKDEDTRAIPTADSTTAPTADHVMTTLKRRIDALEQANNNSERRIDALEQANNDSESRAARLLERACDVLEEVRAMAGPCHCVEPHYEDTSELGISTRIAKLEALLAERGLMFASDSDE